MALPSLALALGLSASRASAGPAARAEAKSAPPTEPTAAQACREVASAVGPERARVTLRLWVDPVFTGPGSAALLGYETWLELLRLHAARPDELRVEFRLARRDLGRGQDSARGDEVRALLAKALETQPTDQVLRVMAQRGVDELRRALDRPGLRRHLAGVLGLAADGLEGADLHCTRAALDVNERRLRALAGGGSFQFPVLEIEATRGSSVLPDPDHRLHEITERIDQLDDPQPGGPWISVTLPPGPEARSRDLDLARSYPEHGMLIGGPGLAHQLLIFADDERTPLLGRALEIALELRAEDPGMLGVQVIAVGSGEFAETLTRRACAARQLGLELPYAHWLTLGEVERESEDQALIEGLDAVGAQAPCEATEIPDIGRTGPEGASGRRRSLLHTRGLWLDGQSVSENELLRLQGSQRAATSRAEAFFSLPPESL